MTGEELLPALLPRLYYYYSSTYCLNSDKIRPNCCSRSVGGYLYLLMQLQRKGKLSVTAFFEIGSTLQKPLYALSFSSGSFMKCRETHHCFIIACKSCSVRQCGMAKARRPIAHARFWAKDFCIYCEESIVTIFRQIY